MTRELTEGCSDSSSAGVRCGLIGEIGCSWPLESFEKRAIVAAAGVQEALKWPSVSFHPGRDKNAPEEIVRIFLEAGGKAERTIMSHLESKYILHTVVHTSMHAGH